MKFNPTRQDIRTYLVDFSAWCNGKKPAMIAGTEEVYRHSAEADVKEVCDNRAFHRAMRTSPGRMVIAEVWEIDEKRPEMKLTYSTNEAGLTPGSPLFPGRS